MDETESKQKVDENLKMCQDYLEDKRFCLFSFFMGLVFQKLSIKADAIFALVNSEFHLLPCVFQAALTKQQYLLQIKEE